MIAYYEMEFFNQLLIKLSYSNINTMRNHIKSKKQQSTEKAAVHHSIKDCRSAAIVIRDYISGSKRILRHVLPLSFFLGDSFKNRKRKVLLLHFAHTDGSLQRLCQHRTFSHSGMWI